MIDEIRKFLSFYNYQEKKIDRSDNIEFVNEVKTLPIIDVYYGSVYSLKTQSFGSDYYQGCVYSGQKRILFDTFKEFKTAFTTFYPYAGIPSQVGDALTNL